MKTPSLSEVKKHFENAERVIDAYTGSEFNMSEYCLESVEKGKARETKKDVYINHKISSIYRKSLFDSDKGYAKILTYKTPVYSITKEQVLSLNQYGNLFTSNSLKDMFPKAFETVLEVGKWYFLESGWLCFNTGDLKNCYGFDKDKKWFPKCSWLGEHNTRIDPILKEATESEVFEALKKEAVRRGFGKKGVYFKDGMNSETEVSEIEGFDFWNSHKNNDEPVKWNMSVGREACVIFRGTTGRWAEIIPTITKEEAEKLLNKKIV